MSEDEFSEQLVEDIIQVALKVKSSQRSIPLGLGDSTTFERLVGILRKQLPNPDVQFVISQLRDMNYEGLGRLRIQELHAITNNCMKCKNVSGSAQLPKWNLVDPDICFVMENPNTLSNPQTANVFMESIKKAGFSSSRSNLTYVTRCPIKNVEAHNVENCLDFLYTELALLKPKLIVAFGGVTFGAITGFVPKVKEYEGQIIWIGSAAIMLVPSIAYLTRQKGEKDAITTVTAHFETAHKFCYESK